MSHLSRGEAVSGYPKSDNGMDGSDWEEIIICDTPSSATKIGNIAKNRAHCSLVATNMS